MPTTPSSVKPLLRICEVQTAPAGSRWLDRQGKQTMATRGRRLQARAPEAQIQRLIVTAAHLPSTTTEHRLRRALQIDRPMPQVVVMQGCHEPMLRLERDDVACGEARPSPRAASSPAFSPSVYSAPSVGSPSSTHWSEPPRTTASLHNSPARAIARSHGSARAVRLLRCLDGTPPAARSRPRSPRRSPPPPIPRARSFRCA